MKILLIDSGIGGISIYNYLKREFPNNDYTYLIDNKNFPYGNKSENDISNILKNEISIKTEGYDLVIIACNTLSIAYEQENITFMSPTVTMFDFHKFESLNRLGEKVTILCTDNSSKSNIWKKYYPNCNVISGKDLAKNIEYQDSINIQKFLLEIPNENPIILSCTHYNFIKEFLKYYVDSSHWAKEFISNSNDNNCTSKLEIIFTGKSDYENEIHKFII